MLSQTTIEIIIAIVLAYLIGSIPSSVWIGKLFYGVDVRNHESGNAGATNTIRVLGAKAGIPVLLFDVFKGWFAIHISDFLGAELLSHEQLINYQMALGISALIGHVFPIYVRFKGGKGIATLVGITIALFPYPLLVVIGLFIVVFIITEYVSLGSIVCALAFPFIVIFIFHITYPSLVIFSIAIAVFIPITHQKNIKRLLKGEESKFKIRGRR